MTANSFRLAALLLLFGLGLTACGVNGAPDPPTPDKFPRPISPARYAGDGSATTAAPAPAPTYPPNTTNTNQPMYQ